MKSRLGMYDGGTSRYKFPDSIKQVSDRTPNSQTLTVRWADANNDTFSTDRTMDTSLNSKMTRLGRFQRRNIEIEYTGSDMLRIEALEMPLTVGDD